MRVRLAVRMMSSDSTSIRFTTPSFPHLPKKSCNSTNDAACRRRENMKHSYSNGSLLEGISSIGTQIGKLIIEAIAIYE